MDDRLTRPWTVATQPLQCSGCTLQLCPGDLIQRDDNNDGLWGECCGDPRPAYASTAMRSADRPGPADGAQPTSVEAATAVPLQPEPLPRS